LLALVLRSGAAGENVLDLATSLLAEFGGLPTIATARAEELAQRPGVGSVKAAALVAAFELGRRVDQCARTPVLLRAAEDVARVANAELNGARRERALVLVCDSANQLRRTVIVSEGSIDRSMLPVREILNAVLRHDGRAFALAHNHPSGDPTPSAADREATTAVATAARVVGVRFLGHVVVAGGHWEEATASQRRPG
jgi:DNA repair protein RadC